MQRFPVQTMQRVEADVVGIAARLYVGADVININALQGTYPHQAVLDPVTYYYGNIELMLGQDVYQANCTLE